MTTQVKSTDTLPKDAGGAKFAALWDAQTSQGDFALVKGIGTSPIGSPAQRIGHMAVATHTQGCMIEALHPLVAVGGVYIENIAASPAASAVSGGSAQIAGMTNWNELLAIPAAKSSSHVSTSRNLVKNASGIVFGFSAAWAGANESSPITLDNSDRDMMSIMVTNTSGFASFAVPPGGVVFATDIRVKQPAGTGNASVTVIYR